jgi:hypothetical protein
LLRLLSSNSKKKSLKPKGLNLNYEIVKIIMVKEFQPKSEGTWVPLKYTAEMTS